MSSSGVTFTLFYLILFTISIRSKSISTTSSTSKNLMKPAKILEEWQTWRGCIDSHTAKYMIQYKEPALQEPQNIISSINLGITNEPLKLTESGLILPNKDTSKEALLATWEEIEMISNKKQGCYALYDDDSKPWHISSLSGNTGISE